jgi:hypothetical protein
MPEDAIKGKSKLAIDQATLSEENERLREEMQALRLHMQMVSLANPRKTSPLASRKSDVELVSPASEDVVDYPPVSPPKTSGKKGKK